MWNIWRKITGLYKNRFAEASLKSSDFSIPFKNNYNNLALMYELRNWYITNSLNYSKNIKYTNEMSLIQR